MSRNMRFVAPLVGAAFLAVLIYAICIAIFASDALAAATVTTLVPGPGTPAPQPDGPVATGVNLWLALVGSIAPLVAYLLNHYAPWISVQAKSIVQAAVAAGGAVLYQIISAGTFGWNQQTAVAVGTAILFSVLARLGYKMGGIDIALGAGVNSNGQPETSKQLVG